MSKFLKLFDPRDPGKMLLTLNALGIAFAALSNTYAAAKDKDTPAEDKKFLVPAGLATGVANLGVYYLLTNNLIKKLKDGTEKSLKKMPIDKLQEDALKMADKGIKKAEKGFLGTGLFKKSEKYISDMKSTLISNGKPTKKAINDYKKNIVDGAGVLGAFIGAVVGCAIITPIIRDISSYFVQKKMGKKIEPELQTKITRSYLNSPEQDNKPLHISRNPMNMNAYMTYARQGMKV